MSPDYKGFEHIFSENILGKVHDFDSDFDTHSTLCIVEVSEIVT